MNRLHQWKPVLAMLGVDFFLAVVNILFKKALNEGLSHLILITYRHSISAVFLTPIALCCERQCWKNLTGLIVCAIFLSALFGGTLSQYFFVLGLKYTSATYACAFINVAPVFTFIMAVPLHMEKVNMKSSSGRAKVLGTLIGLGGALLLTLYKGNPLINSPKFEAVLVQKANHGAKEWAMGTSFLCVGSFFWSAWFLIQARIGSKYPFKYSSTTIMSFFGAIQSAILCLIVDRNNSRWILKGSLPISSVIYAGVVGSGLCYVVMSWCVKQKGPLFTSAFSPFIQIFVAVFDVSLLHEQINLGSILGSIVVIVGMYILLWGKSNEADFQENVEAEGKATDCNLNLPVTVQFAANSTQS